MKFLLSALAMLVAAGCSNSPRDPAAQTATTTYDAATGRLKEIASDADGDGRIDTWTDMEGARALRSRQDRNGDGRIDRWEYYDAAGRMERVGFSRGDTGTPDAWAYAAPGGAVERIEISSTADETRIDRWERYDRSGLVAASEDADHDGAADTWQTYASGAITTAAFDETHDGKPDRRLTYAAGVLVTIESAPDAQGRFTRKTDVQRPDHAPHRP